MTGEQWGIVIQTELVKIWVESFVPAEMQAYARACPDGRLDWQLVPAELFEKLDTIILEQAETLGWRISLSELVRYRFSEWDSLPSGPELFEKLGQAWRNSAKILQGRKKPPIEDPDQWAVKNETVEELRLILQALRGNLATRRREPSGDEVRRIFADTVVNSPHSFPHLGTNLERWLKFLDEARPLRQILRGERLTPGALYDQFLAWAAGWEPDSIRQTISRLKP